MSAEVTIEEVEELEARRTVRFVDPSLLGAVARVQAVVDRLDVSRFPMRMKVRVAVGAMLCVEMTVNDRERPEDTTVVLFSQRIPRLAHDERFAHDFVYSVVKRAVVHELDECWLVDGERVRDPHGPR